MSTVKCDKEKPDPKLNQLEQIKKYTKIVADTGDFETIREFKPEDATTNPSLIYAATQKENYSHFLEEVLASRRKSGTTRNPTCVWSLTCLPTGPPGRAKP